MKQRSDWAWGCWLLLALPLFLLLGGVPLRLAGEASSLPSQLVSPVALQAMRLSLWTSAVSLTLTVAFGTPLAFALARGRFPLRRVFDALVDLPVVLPPAAAGIGLLLLFGRSGALGAWLGAHGIDVVFTPLAVILAQVFVASPYYVRAAVSAFAGLDRESERCAAVDGASRGTVLTRISLPIVKNSLLAGAAMSWARSLGEFGATILVAGNFEGRTQTMPLAIYTGFETDLDSAVAMSCALMAVAVLVLLGVKALDRRPES